MSDSTGGAPSGGSDRPVLAGPPSGMGAADQELLRIATDVLDRRYRTGCTRSPQHSGSPTAVWSPGCTSRHRPVARRSAPSPLR
ncbi:hypothetical protein [Curtobacterium sp. 24E2]|nr:hypothetical protein JN350_03800 [Curtobacterium sp. 24E2]